jgi:AcrR family transcriptional regulator
MQVRSVAAEARRAQILAATIEVIAEVGYRQTSFARIAERGGLSSTRLISYHFAGKDELIGAVATEVIGDVSRFMTTRVRGAGGAAATLRAYIEGVVEYVSTHRASMKALTEIVFNGAVPYGAGEDRQAVGPVEAILRQGQRDGEFRDFDPVVVAVAVQRAVEGLPFLLAGRPDLDCAAYARELVTLFDLGTRAAP